MNLSQSPLGFQLSNNFSPFYVNSSHFNNKIKNNNVYFNSDAYNKDKRINSQNEHNLNKKNPKNKNNPKKFYQKFKKKRPLDWICNRCSNLNYSFRTFCNICNLPLKDNPYYKSNFD